MRTKKVYSSPPRFYLDDKEVGEKEYEAATNPTRLQDMLATRQLPCCITDAALFQGNWNQFAARPNDGAYYEHLAKQRGLKSAKGKVYLSSLAAFPGDPRAWVDGRGDIKRLCEERNWNCNGLVKHEMHNDYPIAPTCPIDEDLVDEEVANILEETPDVAPTPKEKLDLREKTRNRMKGHRKG